jgi:hypothetical protein
MPTSRVEAMAWVIRSRLDHRECEHHVLSRRMCFTP